MPTTHHTKDKGDIAVALTIADLTCKGYACFSPIITEHLPFDLIAYKDGSCLRIQVKYSADGHVTKGTAWNDRNGTHAHPYNPEDFDFYAIYLPAIEKIVYPSIAFAGKVIAFELPNSATPFYWYEDFLTFTSEAKKHSYKEFGYELTHSCTELTVQSALLRRKVARPSREELEKLLLEKPLQKIALDFGVSDKAIAKWAKAYNLTLPGRGYWSKAKAKALPPSDS